MAFNLVCGIICLIFLNIVLSERNDEMGAQEFYDSIPADEQEYFISYSLAIEVSKEDDKASQDLMQGTVDEPLIIIPDDLNIPEEILNKFQNMYIPKDFSHDLYHWVQQEYKMGQEGIAELAVRSQYCFPDGHCIELDDVGNTCCPF